MSNLAPDPHRRSLFDLFRDPEHIGRELGRAYRELRHALYPPTVPRAEYEQAVSQIEGLASQVEALKTQHDQDQATIQQLVSQVVEQDKKLAEIIDTLKKSPLTP